MLCVAVLLLASALGSAATPAPSLPTVDLGYELHQATYNESGQYYNFSNVRYGAPPLGKLRFSAPQAPSTNGTKVFNNGSRAVTCFQVLPAWAIYSADWIANGTAAFNISAGYQVPKLASTPPFDPTATEDCLFLDVMVPRAIFEAAGQGPGAPVMVWIHGGGYTLGSKTLYSPSAAGLIKASQSQGRKGIIWVAMNYRLGAFGFLSGPTFQESGTANAGLHDQRLALEWVQQHIAKFGGNPNQVTVIGESAGGGSTMHQITAFGGLQGKVPFQQAIVQSPGFQMSPSVTLQEAIYSHFLAIAGINTLEDARNLSTEALALANYKLVGGSSPYGTFTFNPVVDGAFAPDLPGQLLLHGGFDKSLKIMAGHNLNEGLGFMDPFAQSETVFEADLRIYFPTITDATVNYISHTLYPPVFDGSAGYTTPTGRSELMITEAFFTCSTNFLARAYNNNVFNYIFSVPPSLHGDDISYTYYNGPNPLVKNDTLAVIMQRYFTNFVMTGNPNAAGLPPFPTYGATTTVQNLNLTKIGPMKDNAANERCMWWQKGLYA
ncbi:uncharacterized protein A1O5_06719 [Cladophialophora psammophila CBS 110553]|uniref:Carboxylic ester hydrolase n=1 Tax=Cladophialophora psammophila CBS 110553 TaxID=1182543 RepID=W9WP14_9EURO|nr:uncharacterized protein A1O5_06719 [Cladophialophora psammophila CBS 110553]EXJ69648.1 hypothetical protein A1O5_06719 [Cladophialophora psammophila CBS 110553]